MISATSFAAESLMLKSSHVMHTRTGAIAYCLVNARAAITAPALNHCLLQATKHLQVIDFVVVCTHKLVC